jgi:ribosomal protein L11 methyltransferase
MSAPVADGEQWVAVRVQAPEAAADAVTNFLFEHGAAAVIDDVHFEPGPRPSAARSIEAHVRAADAAAVAAALRDYAIALVRLDASLGPIEVATAPVPPTDWEGVFRAHHRPLAIGQRLLVAPPWDVPPAGGREVLVVEPGMAFGTGQHATTRTCLEELEAVLAERPVTSVLDAGTGTGILALAALRLGVPHVVAFDVDAEALPVARATLARNGASAVVLLAGTLDAIRGHYDLVLANLLAGTLVAEAPALRAHTAPGGSLIASGILEQQADAVAAAFAPWPVASVRADGPWRTLRFTAGSSG